MKLLLSVLIFQLLGLLLEGAASPKGDILKTTCTIEGDNYSIRVENVSTETVFFWIALSANDKAPSQFSKVPVGAQVFVSKSPYLEKNGFSSLILTNDILLKPVAMVALLPGELKSYNFSLEKLWWPFLKDSRESMRKSGKKFKVRINIYLDNLLKNYVTCETEWHDF